MQMTPEARTWLDETVKRILARHPLGEPERAGVHYELMSHLHGAGEVKAQAAGRAEVTKEDLFTALVEMGGEDALASAFVLPLAKPLERVLFWRRLGAVAIDFLLLGIASAFLSGILYLVMSPVLAGHMHSSDPFGPDFGPFWWGDFSSTSDPVTFAYHSLSGIVSSALVLGYFAWLEMHEGRSLGKRALGLRVVRIDGRPMTYRESIIRNLVKLAPPLLILDTIVMLVAFRADAQRVSDKIAETIVVRA